MMTDHTPEWVKNAVFYQIFVDRFANGDHPNDPPGVVPWGSTPKPDNFFGGDLQGILDHLPYLVDLGVTAVYLTPIFAAQSNHKYDTYDYLAIDHSFGTPQLFRKFIDEAHSRGIRVVLDAVFNHCGDRFWAFEDVKKRGDASPYRDWFYTTTFPIRQDSPNYQTCGGVASMPKLKVTNPKVQEYLLKVAIYWLQEFGVDGWRLDVPWKINRDFWRTFREAVKQINPESYIVGEVWRDPEPWLEGDICDGIMNYPLRDYILDYCVRDTMDAEDFDYATSRLRDVCGPSAPYQMNLLGSHDTPRILTLCKNDIKRAALAITALFTTVGSPMIYYGDEIGLVGENDPGCRGSMRWDEKEWNNHLLNTYRILINVRTDHPALYSENLEKLVAFNGIYAYRRYSNEDEVIIILNPREEGFCQKIPLSSSSIIHKKWRDIFTNRIISYNKGYLMVDNIPSQTAIVLIPDK
jgi:cyclomaltodextrinase / maltogenic alpha-amylase / neopullulanase